MVYLLGIHKVEGSNPFAPTEKTLGGILRFFDLRRLGLIYDCVIVTWKFVYPQSIHSKNLE